MAYSVRGLRFSTGCGKSDQKTKAVQPGSGFHVQENPYNSLSWEQALQGKDFEIQQKVWRTDDFPKP